MPIVDYNVDAVTWGINDVGNLVPRATPLDLNYPAENVTKDGTIYGYNDQYNGSYAGGGATPTTPTLTVTDNQDGSTATATISGSDSGSTNIVYGWLSFGGILSLTNMGSRSGDGDVTITQAVGNYQAVAISLKDSSYSIPSDPWPFTITGAYKYQFRDNSARVALHILMHLGVGDLVTYQNGSQGDAIEVWSKIIGGKSVTTLRNDIFTGEQDLVLEIPRQTGFPPGETADAWLHTGTITYNSEVFAIDNITPGNGIPRTSAIFTIECSRSKSGTF